ncbi:ABC transporter permease subunit [Peribacillus acanthi]|uniref:ABC transporter permease subunit n=1 Tax=Peribacillus acanthi TaxID=2171554 RepID=UPI000D3E09B4|nr:ABC transporter permease subunit [Peribacillus acanthi]
MVVIRMIVSLIALASSIVFLFVFPQLLMHGEKPKDGRITGVEPILKDLFDGLKHLDLQMMIDYWKVPMVYEGLSYTMTLLVISLFVTSVVGVILAIVIHSLPAKWSTYINRVLNLFEGVPDLLIIFVLQVLVIALYKSTGIKFLKLYGIGQTPYFVPIFIISVLPGIFMTKFFVKVIGEELKKDYILVAKAKGLGMGRLLFTHVIRNTVPFYLLQVRFIIWMMLSQIVLVESLFSLHGFSDMVFYSLFKSEYSPLIFISILTYIGPLLVIEIIIRFAKGRNREVNSL